MFQEGDGFGLPDPMGLDQFDLGILQVSRASGASFSGASFTPPWLTPAVSRPGPCLTPPFARFFQPQHSDPSQVQDIKRKRNCHYCGYARDNLGPLLNCPHCDNVYHR